jgi:uncharacterized damage-inducible protein DinB
MTTPAITLEELLAFADESARNWLRFLDAQPAVQQLPCAIFNTGTVPGLVRHIFAVEFRFAKRLAGQPVPPYASMPDGPLPVLTALHDEAVAQFRVLLADSSQDWNETIEWVTLTAGTIHASRRKMFAHPLFHAVRHWAQLASLARAAGFPPPFPGDLLVSDALA